MGLLKETWESGTIMETKENKKRQKQPKSQVRCFNRRIQKDSTKEIASVKRNKSDCYLWKDFNLSETKRVWR